MIKSIANKKAKDWANKSKSLSFNIQFLAECYCAGYLQAVEDTKLDDNDLKELLNILLDALKNSSPKENMETVFNGVVEKFGHWRGNLSHLTKREQKEFIENAIDYM